jgi:TonB family protein
MTGLLELGTPQTPRSQPARGVRANAFTAVFALHVILILVLSYTPRHRLGAAASGPKGSGIGAFFDPGTTGTTGALPETRKVTLVSAKAASREPKPAPSQTPGEGGQAGGGSTGVGGGDGSAGPVRIGSGLVAITKVQPIYPPIMERARMEGTVVLDAVIHRDGTVGEIRVLKSSGPAFEESATKAVSQWLYAALPYEGILTVTVNFNLPH